MDSGSARGDRRGRLERSSKLRAPPWCQRASHLYAVCLHATQIREPHWCR